METQAVFMFKSWTMVYSNALSSADGQDETELSGMLERTETTSGQCGAVNGKSFTTGCCCSSGGFVSSALHELTTSLVLTRVGLVRGGATENYGTVPVGQISYGLDRPLLPDPTFTLVSLILDAEGST